MDKVLITNIQRFSLHDGPGIRTTVFLKGCSACCPWCSNPENISPQVQTYVKDGVQGAYGKYLSFSEVTSECLKDILYYEGALSKDQWRIKKTEEIDLLPGGVTFSGGECLLQMKQLVPICKVLHENNVHIAVETSLFARSDDVRFAVENVDFFYVDIKLSEKERCEKVLHGNLDVYLNNLDILARSERPLVFRIPVIGGMTDDERNREGVIHILERYKGAYLKVEIIKGHNLGASKYTSLGHDVPIYIEVDDKTLERYSNEIRKIGVVVDICKI